MDLQEQATLFRYSMQIRPRKIHLVYYYNPLAINSQSGSGTTRSKLLANGRSKTSRLCTNDIVENQTLHRPKMDILKSPYGFETPIFPPNTTSHLMMILIPPLLRSFSFFDFQSICFHLQLFSVFVVFIIFLHLIQPSTKPNHYDKTSLVGDRKLRS